MTSENSTDLDDQKFRIKRQGVFNNQIESSITREQVKVHCSTTSGVLTTSVGSTTSGCSTISVGSIAS